MDAVPRLAGKKDALKVLGGNVARIVREVLP